MTTSNASIAETVAQKNCSTVLSLPTSKCQHITVEEKEENDDLSLFEQAWYEQWEFSHCAYSELDLHY